MSAEETATTSRYVVVGYDPQWQADGLLALAAGEAAGRGAALAVVTVTGHPSQRPGERERPHGSWISGTGSGYQQVERRYAGGRGSLERDFPDVRIEHLVMPYEEVSAGARPFRSADLLVVGARERHRNPAFGEGTPGARLLAAVTCPVLTVPEIMRPGIGLGQGPVVAALCGEVSDLGVGEASAFEARRRHSALQFLHSFSPESDLPVPRLVMEAVNRISSVLPASVSTDGGFSLVLTREAPVQALCRASRTADLLVLGSRPDALTGSVIGSVSHDLLAMAECPVMITRFGDVALHAPLWRPATAKVPDQVRL